MIESKLLGELLDSLKIENNPELYVAMGIKRVELSVIYICFPVP